MMQQLTPSYLHISSSNRTNQYHHHHHHPAPAESGQVLSTSCTHVKKSPHRSLLVSSIFYNIHIVSQKALQRNAQYKRALPRQNLAIA